MKRLGLAAAITMVVTILAPAGVGAEPPVTSAPNPEKIAHWVKLLDHDDFQQREEASRQLIKAGAPAIPAVAKAAASDSHEVAWRAGVILQQIGISSDVAVMTDVIQAMAHLEKSGKRSFKKSGAEIIRRWKQHRDEQAIAAVRRLGGEVEVANHNTVIGGLGGGLIPAPAIAGPIIIKLDDGRVEEFEFKVEKEAIALKGLDGLKVRIAEEADAEEGSVVPLKPLATPKLPEVDHELDVDKADTADTAKPIEKDSEVNLAELERFLDELKRSASDSAEMPVRLDSGTDNELAEADPAEEDAAAVLPEIDLFLDDLEPAPAPMPAFGGGFGGDFGGGVIVWDAHTASKPSRLVRLGKQWKGTAADLAPLGELSGLTTLELDDFDLNGDAIKQIARLKQLERLQIRHSRFKREELLALKRANPGLSIYATGETLLGVAGQPHADGFVVTTVVSGSAASKAGMQTGDILTEAEGIRLTSVDELTIAIAHKKVGDPLSVTFKRNGTPHTVTVELGRRD